MIPMKNIFGFAMSVASLSLFLLKDLFAFRHRYWHFLSPSTEVTFNLFFFDHNVLCCLLLMMIQIERNVPKTVLEH
jgi:hypothetical protein